MHALFAKRSQPRLELGKVLVLHPSPVGDMQELPAAGWEPGVNVVDAIQSLRASADAFISIHPVL